MSINSQSHVFDAFKTNYNYSNSSNTSVNKHKLNKSQNNGNSLKKDRRKKNVSLLTKSLVLLGAIYISAKCLSKFSTTAKKYVDRFDNWFNKQIIQKLKTDRKDDDDYYDGYWSNHHHSWDNNDDSWSHHHHDWDNNYDDWSSHDNDWIDNDDFI